MISNYNQFLLLEAKIEFLTGFEKILNKLKNTSVIARHLLNLVSQDLKVSTNYINITDKDDMVSFLNPSSREKKQKIVDNGYTYTTWTYAYRLCGLPNSEYPALPDGTLGQIVKILDLTNTQKIAHFLSDDGKNCLIGVHGLEEVSGGKPQEGKIGRISSNLLRSAGIEFTNKEMEDFVNQYKSRIEMSKDKFHRFKLVKENQIRTFYNENKYTTSHFSTLHDSCMRYQKCQKYLEIYCANPGVCSLLILESEDESDKIDARALVWVLVDGTIFMDRIYTSQDFQIDMFKEYARSKGWCYKCKQDNLAESTIEFKPPTDCQISGIIKSFLVQLENSQFTYYPYMDTLKYVNMKYDTLSNTDTHGSKLLEDIDGGGGDDCERCDGDGTVDCPECNGSQEIECPRCDGTGFEDCHTCETTGTTECPDCDGLGKTFDGSSEFTCERCHGKGEITCEDCNGSQEVTCGRCGGDIHVECQNCDCDGRVECPDCDGTGTE